MPTVGIPRDPLFAGLGLSWPEFTIEQFEELCFEFGIELDEVVEEEVKGTKTRCCRLCSPICHALSKALLAAAPQGCHGGGDDRGDLQDRGASQPVRRCPQGGEAKRVVSTTASPSASPPQSDRIMLLRAPPIQWHPCLL
jgi:hypothetical protein